MIVIKIMMTMMVMIVDDTHKHQSLVRYDGPKRIRNLSQANTFTGNSAILITIDNNYNTNKNDII